MKRAKGKRSEAEKGTLIKGTLITRGMTEISEIWDGLFLLEEFFPPSRSHHGRFVLLNKSQKKEPREAREQRWHLAVVPCREAKGRGG